MFLIRSYILLVLIPGVIGCGAETLKRTTYETLQNVRQKDCNKQSSIECEKRDSMEVNEDRRKEASQ